MKIRSRAGFTLIEVALVTIITGILLAAALDLYSSYYNDRQRAQTVENMRIAESALRQYYSLYGRYPCPADPTAGSGSALFGIAQCRVLITDPCPPGQVCTNVGARDVNGDGTAETVTIGAIPFDTIAQDIANRLSDTEFEAANSFDGFGNKISYAVTESMTNTSLSLANPANPQSGAVAVKDENNRDVTQPADSVHFVLVSHGDDGKGAFTRDGTNNMADCQLIDIFGNPAPAGNNIGMGGVEVQLENCDRNDGIYVSGLRSLVTNFGRYYDDIVFFNANAASSLWQVSLFSPPQPDPYYLYNTNFGMVGVGLTDPISKLQVSGQIRAEVAAGAEWGYCDGANPNVCLFPASLDGDPFSGSGMICPAGEVAIGIQDNTLVCVPLFTATMPIPSCPPGQALTGFSNLGNRTCANYP